MMRTQARTRSTAIGALSLSLIFAASACSGDEPVDPPISSGPSISAFTSSANTVARGGKVTLSWTVTKASSISIVATPGGTLVDADTNLTGTKESNALDVATTFKLTATDADGKTAEKSITVNIDEAALSITSFEALPNPAMRGGTTELRWRTTGAESVVIKENGNVIHTAPANARDNGSTLSPTLTNTTHTFVLEATGSGETLTEMITVAAELAPTLDAFTVSPATFVGASQVVTLSWMGTNISSLRLNQNGSASTMFTPPANLNSGTVMITVTETTVFELIASSGGGEARRSGTVAKTSPEVEPNDDYMNATPLTTGAAAGEISTADDRDFYSFMVGANSNVFASVKNADGSCPFTAFLTLNSADGTEIGSVFPDFTGVDDCPNIDPRFDSFASDLDAGTYFVSVNSYDGLGPYTLVVIVTGPGCGNGVFEEGELCDDGNTASGDNCNAQCQFETIATISPPSGSATANVAPYAADTTGYYRWIQINLPMANQSIEVTTGNPGGGCTNLDTYVALIDATTFFGESYDDGEDGACAAIRFPEDTFAIGLPAGTYYLLVANESATDPASIEVNVTIHDPGCGNGAVEMGEQCDDGNMAGGDGCGATCTIEPLGTVMGPPGEMTFSGAIDPGPQQDYYAVVLTGPGYIFAQTFAPVAPTCTPTTTDTVITLFDSALTEIAENDDAGSTRCSTLRPSAATMLTAGTYFVRVTSYSGFETGPLVIPAYQVTIRTVAAGCGNAIVEMNEQCDDGNMAAGDGCTAQCGIEAIGTVMGPPANQTFMNELDPVGEVDYYRVTLTAPGYIEAETFTSMVGTCTPTTTDTALKILDDTLTVIDSNDDIDSFADNLCSRIAPISAADMLQAGNYWVAVNGFSRVIPTYGVRIRVTAAGCGNLIQEPGEICDDGNTTAGDGCSATCQFEGMITNESEPNDTAATADNSGAGRNRSVLLGGAITIGDVDFYTFTVTGAAFSISARTHTNPADPEVCGVDVDTTLFLLDSTMNVVAENDDFNFPSNACSFIDPANDPDATMLPAGTYYLEVHEFDDDEAIPSYFLTVGIQ